MVLNLKDIDTTSIGSDCYALAEKLFPICRSITGEGVRETLQCINDVHPIKISEISTGDSVFDWEVPKEWNIKAAYLKDKAGNVLVDFDSNNLHVVSYSQPIAKKISLEELKPHLHYLEDYPDWIPYRTTYYEENWGICLPYNLYKTLSDDEYEVFIDSSFHDGGLSIGEAVIKGQSENEFLIFAHTCHPSLCNDNLSGISIAINLAKKLSQYTLRNTYRLVFAPATIGSIAWMSQNQKNLKKIKAGLVLACLGDSGVPSYKKTKSGNDLIDRIATKHISSYGEGAKMIDFSPWGYDERQFSSPGINLPIGRLTRTPHGEFDEYHTSADNLDFIKPEFLADSFEMCLKIINSFENNRKFINTQPYGEPQLGKRGLYRKLGGYQDVESHTLAMLWVLNQSDGSNYLIDIAESSGISFDVLVHAAGILEQSGLLQEVN